MATKIRVIPTLLYKDFGLVKGVSFDSWRRVGSAIQAIKVYNLREVDELIFLDIAATPNDCDPDYDMIDDLADECFVPLAVGGGVKHIDHIRKLLSVGADKVVINTEFIKNPDIVRQASQIFGSQCIVVSIDAKRTENGSHVVYTHSGKVATELDPVSAAVMAENHGAGEIIVTSIDSDGTMMGYDVELTRLVSESVSIPVIASGGAGNYEHMVEVLRDGKASAVAAASIFHFTHQTPLEAKLYLRDKGFNVRS
ncbi:MAG: imidazole glycerol phosphate synthase subunit HisF [Chloroflexus sp.]|uniref:imidazole glycerol phosphate synthase subunit HisF n=1 Tax=Chloroflexus sp. TaxID=1904827 RepID=UPI00404A065E